MDQAENLAVIEPVRRLTPNRRAEFVPSALDDDESVDLRVYWRVLAKRRWTILATLLAIFGVTLIATLKETPLYRAHAMLEIEKENPNILTVQELFQLEDVSDSYLVTQYKVLQSESLARRVISRLHLDQLREFNPYAPAHPVPHNGVGGASLLGLLTPYVPNARAEQAVLKRFEDDLSVDPVRQSRLVEIGFESRDPHLAAQIVNTLADGYIEQNLENRWDATQKATEWLSQQLDGLKIKLEKSEDELQRYAEQNGLLYLESDQGKTENIVDERLRQLQEELTAAQADRYQKESLYRLVQAGDFGSLPGAVDNKLMQDLTFRLAEMDGQYAQLSATFNPDYPTLKALQDEIDSTRNTLDTERQRVAQKITDEYTAARRREALVEQAFQDQEKTANIAAARAVQYNILKREVDTNRQLYEGLLERMKEAGVSAGLKASNIRVVDQAVSPVKPVKPRVLLNLSLGFVLGLGGGIALAFLCEHLDNTLKTAEDVERYLLTPALAMIPSAASLNGHRNGVYGLASGFAAGHEPKRKSFAGTNGHGAVLTHKGWFRIDEISSQLAALPEAFRSLRTSVLLSTAERPPRTLLVTSAQPGEGKSTIATNLSISLAQLGHKVLLIDGDLRRPILYKVFQIRSVTGLVGYLTGGQDWRDVVVSTAVNGLDLIPSGPIPPNPAELLSSERLAALIGEAQQHYSIVLIDSPPLLSVADGRVLAGRVEGVVLVVKASVTPRELAQRAQTYARDVGANIIGVVLNNVNVRSHDYYYAYGDYKNYSYVTDDPEHPASDARGDYGSEG